MNVLMVASEAAPLLRTSDVANVVTELSQQLRRQDHDVRIVVPRYRNLNLGDADAARTVLTELDVPLGLYSRKARVSRVLHGFDSGAYLPVYLVENAFYFDRENPFGYLDDYERFIFFTRAVLKMLGDPGFAAEQWQPEVLHGHDWVTGLMPLWLRHNNGGLLGKTPPGFVYTIHNAGFPGRFGRRAAVLAELEELGTFEAIGESANSVDFMARGVWTADMVNTVSVTHAEELKTGRYAAWLAPAIRTRPTPLEGILNGLDGSLFDPTVDKDLEQTFSLDSLHRREANKGALQERCGFAQHGDVPLLGVVSRLIEEKGMGLLEQALPGLLASEDVQVALLGAVGDSHYQEAFTELQKAHPHKVRAFFDFDPVLARRIFAGSDLILIPSLYEPCGLQQMIAMRYGAVPLVRRTGGLADTVSDWKSSSSGGHGFVFEREDAGSLAQAIGAALEQFRQDKTSWRKEQRHNMRVDLSWESPAGEYVRLYQKALAVSADRPVLPLGQVFPPDRGEMLVHAILHADELAAVTTSKQDYLIQVARNARLCLNCDAVVIWVSDDKSPQRLGFGEASLRPEPGKPPADEARSALKEEFGDRVIQAEQGSRVWSWQYIYRPREGGLGLKGQTGLLESRPARTQGWSVQLSVPLTARGRMSGRIDAFRRDPKADFTEWDIGALSGLANVIAANLGQMQLSQRSAALQSTACRMARAQHLPELAGEILSYAKEVTGAEVALLRLNSEHCWWRDEHDVLQAGPPAGSLKDYASRLEEPLAGTGLQGASVQALKRRAFAFSRGDGTSLKALADLAAASLEAALQRLSRDDRRVKQWKRLATSLVRGGGLTGLLDQVIRSTAEVLEVQAASLYLLNDKGRLEIRAAAGYHEPLLQAHQSGQRDVSYAIGEGTTGWIAQTGQTFRATQPDELHRRSPWLGKHRDLQDGREPQAFLGIPLTIEEKVIGVLKFEDKNPPHQLAAFTEEDERLAEMMANVVATVVYNAQRSEQHLRDFSASLRELSKALAGSRDLSTLMDNIVKKIAAVLRADAASLYLANETRTELVIEAAAGYQEPLVEQQVKYEWGKGVTGTIAATGKPVVTQSLQELRLIGQSDRGRYDDLHKGHQQPQSFYGLPLVVKESQHERESEQVIGVLKVESTQARFFSSEDVLLIEMMANVIASVVYNAQQSEKRLRDFSASLRELSEALAGSRDLSTLMDNIVKKIAAVLRVDAASLYLANEARTELVIQAAAGYQEPLMDRHVKYEWGKGVTGTIAATGKPVVTRSLRELRLIGQSDRGKYDDLHKGHQQPQSFYGLPLVVKESKDSKESERLIGVLKVESTQARFFSNEDVLLIEMMANVIASVVYNAQQSETRLRAFSGSLQGLSAALAGSRDMSSLMDSIVKKIAAVLRVDAASLFLADETRTELIVQAAAGYQEPLVEKQVKYKWGEGVTGTIAATKRAVVTQSLQELRRIGLANQGTYDMLHKDQQQPQSFYGLPLVVPESERAIGVLKVESTKARFFSNEDVLLIEMMANVIAVVVYNTQLHRAHLGSVLSELGSVSSPSADASQRLLRTFCRSSERGTLDLLATALAGNLNREPRRALVEAKALLGLGADPGLFTLISGASSHPGVRRRFLLFSQALREPAMDAEKLGKVFDFCDRWASLEENQESSVRETAIHELVELLARECRAEIGLRRNAGKWMGYLLHTQRSFEESYLPDELPLAFHGTGDPDDADFADLRSLLEDQFGGRKTVLLPLISRPERLEDVLARIPSKLKPFAIDPVVADVKTCQRIMGDARSYDKLRSTVLAQIDLLSVSPYQIVDAARHSFAGRETELRQICQHAALASFALVGGRRIGKTSILKQLHHVRLPNTSKVRSVFQTCQSLKSREEFLQCTIGAEDWQPGPPAAPPRTFGELLQRPQQDRPVLLLLDEVDSLVRGGKQDDHALFRELRGLHREGVLQIVVTGERTLREALRDDTSPLYNFTEEIPLGPLDYQAVSELVSTPMRRLEVRLLPEPEIVQRIFDFTSGHPNIVQRLCLRLLKRINRGEARVIRLDDVEAVLDDHNFQEEDFLAIYWQGATPLQRILSLLMVRRRSPCDLTALLDLLEQEGLKVRPTEVRANLESLVSIQNLVRRRGSEYELAVAAFPRVLSDPDMVRVRELLLLLKDDYRGQPAGG